MSMQSDWTFVMGSDCKNCPNNPYRYEQSTSFKLGVDKKSSIVIGKQKETLTLNGFSAIDDICIGVRPNVTNSTD